MVSLTSPDTFTINDFQDATHPDDPVQDTPVVTDVATVGGNTQYTWAFNSTPDSAFTFDFFANSQPNPSGFGDGEKFLQSATERTDDNGNLKLVFSFPADNKFISVTATGPSHSTSEFSMVDSDGDGLADTWETSGIDFDEDGAIDLTLPDANPLHKDLYVEVDAMASVVPKPGALQMVIDSFARAPITNPDGITGITLHAALNEVIPDQLWLGDLNGNGVDALGEDRNANGKLDPGEDTNGNGVLDPGDPADQDPWVWFNNIKQNGVAGVGGFGDSVEQRADGPAMDARRLAYRYALFAIDFARPRANGGTSLKTSGIAEIGGNDFIVTLGKWANTVQEQAGTFMHELGHTLGLHHGGGDDLNNKPNYNSVMNYLWQTPDAWMIDPSGTSEWFLNYSTTALPPLDENHLVEANGINGTPGLKVEVGPQPHPQDVLETGPVDWSQGDADGDGIKNNDIDTGGIDINSDGQFSVLNGFDDWSHIQYSFADNKEAADGAPETEDGSDELTLDEWEAINAMGDGPGLLQVVLPSTTASEDDGEVSIDVIRGDGTDGTVSVNYTTADGTAIGGSDYQPISGTLSFAPGEYIKTLEIPLFDDSYAEPTRSFRLSLSNAAGGAENLQGFPNLRH